jgi:hypothetical protein
MMELEAGIIRTAACAMFDKNCRAEELESSNG